MRGMCAESAEGEEEEGWGVGMGLTMSVVHIPVQSLGGGWLV